MKSIDRIDEQPSTAVVTSHLSGLETCHINYNRLEAEKTGASELHIWTLSLIEEKGSVEKIVSEQYFMAAPLQASNPVMYLVYSCFR